MSSFNTPNDLVGFLKQFQARCNAYGIYAKLWESNQFIPIKVDGILGRQTARALLFVYELGQLAVKFQLVASFKDFVDVFNGSQRTNSPSMILFLECRKL